MRVPAAPYLPDLQVGTPSPPHLDNSPCEQKSSLENKSGVHAVPGASCAFPGLGIQRGGRGRRGPPCTEPRVSGTLCTQVLWFYEQPLREERRGLGRSHSCTCHRVDLDSHLSGSQIPVLFLGLCLLDQEPGVSKDRGGPQNGGPDSTFGLHAQSESSESCSVSGAQE